MDSIISIHNVSYSYPQGKKVFDGVSVEFPKGKKIALIGQNGAGKSTLFWLLNGLFKPDSGAIKFKDSNYQYSKKSLRALHQKIGLLFSNPDAQIIAPSVYEEVSFGLINSMDEEVARRKTDEILLKFDLMELANHPPHQLSSGQKKRVCLASVIAMEPEVLIADEPATHLDPSTAAIVFNELENLNQQGKTIIYASHDIDQVYEWADYLILLNDGKILATGETEDFFHENDILNQCGFIPPKLFKISQLLNIKPEVRSMDGLKDFLS